MNTPKRAHCWNCGIDIGPRDKWHHSGDTCGAHECEREARRAEEAERYEAHEQLDRDLGYGRY